MTRPLQLFLLISLTFIFHGCRENRAKEAGLVKKAIISEQKLVHDTTVIKTPSYYKLRHLFDEASRRGFNGNILVARKGKIIYRDAFGYADFRSKENLTVDSRFQLASVSKQFTAVAIMLLKEQGKLSYLDPVQKFIPEFPYEGINLHLLLSHRSGLPNYVYFCDHLCSDHNTPLSNNDVIGLMSDNKPEIYAKPDRRFQYCNTNYCVLASIVEKVSGMSYRAFLHKYLFDPAGMTETEIFSTIDTVHIPQSVKGHYANKREVKYNYLNGVVGDKGLYSTITDLFRWENALSNEKIIKRETLDEAMLPTSDIKRNGSSYGYGYRLRFLEDSTRIVYHGGWWQGFKSCYMRFPKDETLIVVLSNVANRGFDMGLLLDAYSIITPGFANPYSSRISSRDSLSF